MKEGKNKVAKIPLAYRCFKSYLRILFEHVMYKEVQYMNTESIPSEGTPLLIVSNHQNTLNDAIAILMSMRDRLVRFIVRADVFSLGPGVDKFLRSIGLLPAFRINHEGEAALKYNGATFKDSEKAIAEGHSIVIFPEGGHQTGHWLGQFSYGYTKMAFDAAEMTGFEKDVVILPCCNHYSSYWGIRRKVLVKYGRPISLGQFYELYKTKPRTAQRQVNRLVREQILDMMYEVRDLDNYDAIEFIRNSEYSSSYARRNGRNPDILSEKMLSDKDLVSTLEKYTGRENVNVEIHSVSTSWDKITEETPLDEPKSTKVEVKDSTVVDVTPEVYKKAYIYKYFLRAAGIEEQDLSGKTSWRKIAAELAGMLALMPLAIVALWPSLVSWLVPMHFNKKMEDNMFEGTLLFAVNALFIFPILGVVTLAVVWPALGVMPAIAWVLSFPALCVFEWKYVEWLKAIRRQIALMKARRNGKIDNIHGSRHALNIELDKITGNAEKSSNNRDGNIFLFRKNA